MREKDIQRQITDFLELKHIFFYRQNTGAFKTNIGGFYRFGIVGAPDLICVIKGQYIGIEVKGEKGKQSKGQKDFQRNLTREGGKYILAYSLEDVIENLSNN